jgi:hypothetical protein
MSRRDLQQGVAAAAKVAKAKLDALEIFRPTIYQEAVVTSRASEVLVQGAPRSGKSVIVAAMVASYLRNKPVTFADGSKHDMREPGWQKRPITAWLIGMNLAHIGQTLYRLLCRPGAFDMVRDKQTGLWRAWQPGRIEGDDKIPVDERFPAPPLIPPSEITLEVWQNKAAHEFTSIEMKDGSKCYGFASSGDVKRGDPVNLIWLDEDIKYSSHLAEWQSRLSDRKGRLYWTAWPDMTCAALVQMWKRAVNQRDEVSRGVRTHQDVENFVFNAMKNPFMDDEERRKRFEGWSEDEIKARYYGEFATGSVVAYPEFDKNFHVVNYGDNSPLNDKVTEAMRKLNWNVPSDWCVDLILDPGTTRPAMLWVAIPPKEFWDEGEPYHIVFREMAVPRLNALEMAKRVVAADPGRRYARFIGDSKAGNQTSMGAGHTVFEEYSKPFRTYGLRCQVTGDLFLRGETVWITRSLKLRALLRGRNCGRPRLRIVPHMCPALVKEFEETLKEVSRDAIQDKIAKGQAHDVLDCFHPSMEVLTDRGWKLWPDLDHTERLATVNSQDQLEFQTPSRWIVKDYSGPMITFKSRTVDCTVTPTHRMVVYRQLNRDKWHFVNAEDVPEQNLLKLCPNNPWSVESPDTMDLPVPPKCRNYTRTIDTCDYAELLGWWVAEGSRDKVIRMPGVGYRIGISQVKPEGVIKLVSLLDRIPWHFLRDGNNYICSSKQLWHLMEDMNLGDRSWNRVVPQWIKTSSAKVITAFLKGYLAGDGWVNQGIDRCATTSVALASDIQELYFRLGRHTTILTKKCQYWSIEGRTGQSRDQYWPTLRKGVASLVTGAKDSIVTTSQYEGKVYCATVPNSTLIVRRNLKAMVAGNCMEYYAGFEPTFLAPPPGPAALDPGQAMWDADRKFLDGIFKQNKKTDKGPIVLGLP